MLIRGLWLGKTTRVTLSWLHDLGPRAGEPWGRASPEGLWEVMVDRTNEKKGITATELLSSVATPSLKAIQQNAQKTFLQCFSTRSDRSYTSLANDRKKIMCITFPNNESSSLTL